MYKPKRLLFLVAVIALAVYLLAACSTAEQPSWEGADAMTLWLDRKEASPWLAGLNIHDYDDDPVKAAASLGIDNISPYYEETTPEQAEGKAKGDI